MGSALHASGSTWEWRRIRARVLVRAGHQCHYCGRPATEVDHVIPRHAGGLDTYANLRAVCHRCHVAKTNRDRAATSAATVAGAYRRGLEQGRAAGRVIPTGDAAAGGRFFSGAARARMAAAVSLPPRPARGSAAADKLGNDGNGVGLHPFGRGAGEVAANTVADPGDSAAGVEHSPSDPPPAPEVVE